MKKSFVINALALLTALLTLLASGCRRNTGEPEPTAVPVVTERPSGLPEQGGVLRLPMPANASADDPYAVDTEEMLLLFSLVYDKLLTVDASGEIQPCLCESWSNEGGGSWLLRIREGVKWHDRGTLKASEVVASYLSLVSMEKSYYKPCLDHITSFEEVDEFTIRAVFDTEGLMGLYSLVFPIKKSGELIGTGAFRLEKRDEGEIRLVSNHDWWDKPPYIDRVVFLERDSASTALASYEAGQLNMVPTSLPTAGKYFENGVTDVHDIMTQNMEVLLFNHESSVFRDRLLRLAVAHAVNRSAIITNVYMNRARVADSPIPPDSWLSSGRSAAIGYDPSNALDLIKDAGFTVVDDNGLRYSKAGAHLSIKLLTSATPENTVRSDAAAMIAANLKELGFSVEIVTAPHTLGGGKSDFEKALEEGDWDAALVGFDLGISNELTSYVAEDGPANYGHISDSELKKLSDAMLGAVTEEELREAAFAFHDYFTDTVPFVVLYFRLNSVVCSAKIRGSEGMREPFTFESIKDWYVKND